MSATQVREDYTKDGAREGTFRKLTCEERREKKIENIIYICWEGFTDDSGIGTALIEIFCVINWRVRSSESETAELWRIEESENSRRKNGGIWSSTGVVDDCCYTGLIRYMHPSDDELRDLAGIRKDFYRPKGKGRFQDVKNPSTFHVPKDLEIRLETVKVTSIEVRHLKFYPEYHWAVDFTLYAIIIYIATEIYYGLVNPLNEMNLSVFWCLLSLMMCLSVLGKLTAIYFRGDEVMGERSMCLVMGTGYLLMAMIILIVSEDNLEVGVDSAYQSFHDNASAFLKTQGLDSSGPASKLIVKFTIAVCCAFLGTFFTFPGIRVSKMFWDSLKYCEGQLFLKFWINLSYILPFVLTLLWVKPIGRELFARIPIGTGGEPLMTDSAFESLRFHLVIFMVVLRVVLMPWFLQAFLNVAQDKLNEQIKEAGRILNTEIQKKVAGIYYYLCIVALQYIAPVLVCLLCCLMYKTLGGGSWLGSYFDSIEAVERPDPSGTTPASFLPETDAIKPATEHFAIALASLKQVFNATVFRGIFGFATWWCLFLLFASSAVGSVYLSFLTAA
ncbi:unnamed protein product [Allacma fusca]|uniref:Transmembrane protein 161B n=1 Tax=Allacma fusca TaxID=39272 RepID=A0A8J2LWF7_9HEXA|nr:unnamed protein product [Allacma fusca]